MTNTIYHLAQFNIIKLKDQLNSPAIKEFKDFLSPVNQLAEESPGFVWRLKDEEGTSATNIETPYDDELIFVNLSVWHNFEYLKNYSYKTVHSYFLKNKKKWSNKMDEHQVVLWWVAPGVYPTVIQAKEKLDLLNQFGSSSNAFSLSEQYNQDGTKRQHK